MGVEAVYHVVHGSVLRSLNRKIGCASAAEDQHIQLVLHMGQLICLQNLYACGANLYVLRISAGEDCLQLHVIVLGNGALNTFSQIAVT